MKWVEKNIITFKYKANTSVTTVVIFCLILKESQFEVQEACPSEEPYMVTLMCIIQQNIRVPCVDYNKKYKDHTAKISKYNGRKILTPLHRTMAHSIKLRELNITQSLATNTEKWVANVLHSTLRT
jgi:hypothetical protein